MPTTEQMLTAIITLQSLSNFYRPIYLFRYDKKNKIIFILAGEAENVEIIIYANGERDYEVYE
jgi:hypothetical protein